MTTPNIVVLANSLRLSDQAIQINTFPILIKCYQGLQKSHLEPRARVAQEKPHAGGHDISKRRRLGKPGYWHSAPRSKDGAISLPATKKEKKKYTISCEKPRRGVDGGGRLQTPLGASLKFHNMVLTLSDIAFGSCRKSERAVNSH